MIMTLNRRKVCTSQFFATCQLSHRSGALCCRRCVYLLLLHLKRLSVCMCACVCVRDLKLRLYLRIHRRVFLAVRNFDLNSSLMSPLVFYTPNTPSHSPSFGTHPNCQSTYTSDLVERSPAAKL